MPEQADRPIPENQEEKIPSQVDFVVEPVSEEDLEDVGGGCGICIDGSDIE